jgi:DNA (cytosine-5)-methyltransferase 1
MGLDLGLEKNGFKIKLALEINKAAVETIKKNKPRLPVITESISDATTRQILKKAGLKKKEVTLVAAGPCCQSFSTVGKRRSIKDPRGDLFFDFCRIIKEIQPRFFVMENVKGMLSAAVRHRPLNERGPGFPPLSKNEQLGSGLKLIKRELASLGYYVIFGLLNAADYGVPQKRWRVFFIGSRDGEDLTLPYPTHSEHSFGKSTLLPWVTLRSAIKAVDSKEWTKFAEDRLKLLQQLSPGQNWRNLPKRLHRAALGAAADSWGGRVGFCRRLPWDDPAPTLTTAPNGRATTLCHPTEDRPLSVEEYAALQQFPSSWKFSGSLSQQYEQIGNAVPVGLAAAVGKAIKQTIRKTAKYGLPKEAKKRLGKVICADENLDKRLKNRKATQLHPTRLRKIKDPEKARLWLAASA